jgi:hypothetical protein
LRQKLKTATIEKFEEKSREILGNQGAQKNRRVKTLKMSFRSNIPLPHSFWLGGIGSRCDYEYGQELGK